MLPDGSVLVMGGIDGNWTALNDVLKSNNGGGNWTLLTNTAWGTNGGEYNCSSNCE